MPKTYAYIGNWKQPNEDLAVGVTVAAYHEDTGSLELLSHCFPEINCGATCVNKEKGILYCVNEVNIVPGETLGGQVFALKMDSHTGMLTEINHSPSFGGMPTYCALSSDGSYLVVSNHAKRNSIMKTALDENGKYQIVLEYDEASVVLFRLNEDGSIGEACDVVRHEGRGLLPNQQSPHPHSVMKSPLYDIFIVCDKGNDSVYSYKIDQENGKLVQCDCIKGIAGSSPRYSTFHPTLPYFYYNNETKPVVGVVCYDEEGRLTPVRYNKCTGDCTGKVRGMQSDIRIDAQGRYLYDLVRETGKIVVYEIDEISGIPEYVRNIVCACKNGGRGLALSPDGRYLYMAACSEPVAQIFETDEEGHLNAVGSFEDVAPANVIFYTAEE
ncbi:MAG: lactonase family protein [Lachnospiraceae bacterium]|nr:lactonase family protein [Lachnospiraceae bacterium]